MEFHLLPSKPVAPPRSHRFAMRRRGFAAALLLYLAALSGPAWCGKPDNITDDEIALLPPYCADANTIRYGDATYRTSPNAGKWVAMMGHGFWAIHHYCWALINLMRVEKPSVPISVQNWTREAALGDLTYVLQNTPDDFVLLPEIYTKIGDLKAALKQPRAAAEAYAAAWTRKRDYWPAYYHWAEYLRVNGHKQEARQVVEEGLSYAPDAKPLISLLRDMGGDPTRIVRRQPTSSTSAAAEAPR